MPRRTLRRSRPWFAVGVVGLAVGLAVADAVVGGDVPVASLGGNDVLEVPPLSETSVELLADGRPVFVVHHPDDTVSIMDAFSTNVVYGVHKLVEWCASSRTFEDRFHHVLYNAYGRHLAGPAESGLARFEVAEVDGAPRRVRAGSELALLPLALRPRPGIQGPPCDGATKPWLFHTFDPSSIWDSPADAVAASPAGWIAVRAVLVVRAGQPARLCQAVEEGACTAGAVVGGIDVEAIVGELTTVTLDALWLARIDGDELADLTRVNVEQ